MITLGAKAPQFGCSVFSEGGVRRLNWTALHTGTLLLLFDAQAAHYRRALRLLNQAALELMGTARLALVCHGPLQAVDGWARTMRQRHEPLTLTLILDPEDHIAALYDLLSADGSVLWGQYIIDGAAVVRQAQACLRRVPPDAQDLVRYARAISAATSFDCLEG